MSLNSGLNASLVKTELDLVLFSNFDRENEPQEVLATDSVFFRQSNIDRGSVIYEEVELPGEFTAHTEEQDVQEASPRSGNQVTKTINNYKRDLPIPMEFFDDDQHDTVRHQVEGMAMRARTSRDKFAFQQSYGDAFSGVTTPDGQAAISNSHTTLSGDTVDNLETGALNSDNLETVVRSLRLQKAQDGALGGHVAAGLLTPVQLHPDATEITQSELKSNTADNAINYWSKIYPGMKVGASAYLDSTYNTLNSNANTSYFVVSRNHWVTRWVRKALSTDLVPPQTDKKDRWFYKARFREIVAVASWSGIVGLLTHMVQTRYV